MSPVSTDEPIHVLCTRSFTPEQLARLRAVSPRLVVTYRPIQHKSEQTGVCTPETEVLYATWPPDSLAGLPRLKWFQSRSAGMDAFVGTPLWEARDIPITSASGVHAITMAEYTTGMMIALARDFLGYVSFQHSARWPEAPRGPLHRFPGRELRGATVLIIGYGSVGREVARQCAALGLRVIAVKRDPTVRADSGFSVPGTGDPAGTIPERLVSPAELETVLPLAEYVVLAAALTPASRGLIGETQLRRMRPDAFLINMARGGMVDEAALASALRERRIAGAALDVFSREPLPADSPLWSLDNVILSPHVSGITPRNDDHIVLLFEENLRRYVAGEPLLNLVDRSLGY